ncbi:MAG: helix-turn-helix domain-containing protein [Oscillospiraceae bacterium]|nr:helix-turn-helix domain-containing protein [Oscillospiraceae bacterium]
MESIDRLNRAINYIEENLCENISYNEISKITLSPISAFQRFFCLTTGMALSDYIRRRKLSRAASDILHTDEKIIDIAVKYGYESADAFSVAFKRVYNISPLFARQNQVNLEPFHRLYYTLSVKYIKGDTKMKRIANNRELLDGSKGHNYGLPDCMKFILECVGWGEKPDFWDIAAITGDTVAQVYNRNLTTSCEYCVSGYLAGPEHIKYVFDTLGYDHEYVTTAQLNADTDRYIPKIIEMIDRNIPVLVKTNLNDIPGWHSDVGTHCLIVGYDNGGQIVKLLFDGTETVDCILTGENKIDLIFIGEKQREVTLEELYMKAIHKMTYWLTLPERNGLFFGAAAFRAWADDIEAGRFEEESLSMWEDYGVYVCNLATSGGGVTTSIFKKLAGMNQSHSHLAEIGEKIDKILENRTPRNGRCKLWLQLEELGGGMAQNGAMDKDLFRTTMRDKEKRSKVAAALRDYAERVDQAVMLLENELRQGEQLP